MFKKDSSIQFSIDEAITSFIKLFQLDIDIQVSRVGFAINHKKQYVVPIILCVTIMIDMISSVRLSRDFEIHHQKRSPLSDFHGCGEQPTSTHGRIVPMLCQPRAVVSVHRSHTLLVDLVDTAQVRCFRSNHPRHRVDPILRSACHW